MSLDVLRGFDMFWIIGGKAVILALAAVFSVDLSEWLGHRLHHPEWDGFEPYDLIFPLFLFIAGVSTVYSIDNRLAKGDSRASLHRHFIQRGLTLVLLGIIYNGLLSRDWPARRVGEKCATPVCSAGSAGIHVCRVDRRKHPMACPVDLGGGAARRLTGRRSASSPCQNSVRAISPPATR